ncbi:hypothetical protein LTR36_001990 [Oleoguttula mirabilis]|uniref:Uncharacterized protein n=1 Tax=Oleoguttula mirabilis TaxID=1507867 RepID=A0AAV9JLT5_9PEZI|nr:hypothetical protein LTR36_001990 [Oleoguttula mirabilis]
MSATPPPRRSRNRIDSFENAFGGLEMQERGYGNESLYTQPLGPQNPFSGSRFRDEQPRADNPSGGFGEPRNPYAPGGRRYETQFSRDPRPDHPDARFDEPERRRREYQRSMVGEAWGLANWREYERVRRSGF